MGSCRQRLSHALAPAYPESRLRAQATNYRATAGGSPLAARGRFLRARPDACRGAPGRRQPARGIPYLPRLGLGDCQSGVSTPKAPSISNPTHAVSAPDAPTISLSFAPFGQYPVAHRPSVPRWLAGGSRAVSTPACEAGPSLDGLSLTAYSSQHRDVRRPSERASSLSPPSESQRRYPGPVPRITGQRPPSLPAGPAPRTSALHRAAGSARGRSRPRPAPPPQGASSTGPQVWSRIFFI
jgi:hypothetical protein